MILVNLLAILVKTLVNLLVKLAKLRVRGGHRGLGPGNTLGRGSYDLQLVRGDLQSRIFWVPVETMMRPDETIMKTIARNVAGIARNITRSIHQTYWDLV